MCGSLRHEKVAKRLGSPVVVSDEGVVFQAAWDGHAREESLENWLKAGWKEARTTDITHYTEGYKEKAKEFGIPEGQAIKIVYHPKLNLFGHPPMKIVTRAAEGDEKETHSRFPRLIEK